MCLGLSLPPINSASVSPRRLSQLGRTIFFPLTRGGGAERETTNNNYDNAARRNLGICIRSPRVVLFLLFRPLSLPRRSPLPREEESDGLRSSHQTLPNSPVYILVLRRARVCASRRNAQAVAHTRRTDAGPGQERKKERKKEGEEEKRGIRGRNGKRVKENTDILLYLSA